MKNKRIIKLTERQLAEAEKDAFNYLGNGDFKQYNGQSEISVPGHKNDEEFGIEKDTDAFGNKISSQTYNRYAGFAFRPHTLRENDENQDGVDDFYNSEELDTLGNGNESDDLVKVPESVQHKMGILIDAMQNLTPKQQAIVLNKMIESFDLSSLPYAWLKELRLKINKKNSGNVNAASNI